MNTSNMYKIVLLFLIIIATGCEDWLEVEPKDRLSVSSFFKTEADAKLATTACYLGIRNSSSDNNFGHYPVFVFDYATGQIWTTYTQVVFGLEAAKLKFPQESYYSSDIWSNEYVSISYCNTAIENIPKITDVALTDEEKINLLAEVRFLRAYYYFELIQHFGKVPLIDFVPLTPDEALLPRTEISDIYDKLIVPDLLAAEKSTLPWKGNAEGRVGMGAIKALLSKVYLTMAGYPLKRAAYFAKAKDKAAEIINDGPYELFQGNNSIEGNWVRKFANGANDFTKEHIFMAVYDGENASCSIWLNIAPIELGEGSTKILASYVWDQARPEDYFVNSYDPNDLRGPNLSVPGYKGFFAKQYIQKQPPHKVVELTNWSTSKYYVDELETSVRVNKSFPLIRYAEVLLTFAEAQNEADGSPNAAGYSALNKIRTRSGLTPVSGLSQNEFREEVYKQLSWEFYLEGKTWFNWVRTQKVFDAKTKSIVPFVGYTLPGRINYDAVISEDNIYLSIPTSEIQVNPLLAED